MRNALEVLWNRMKKLRTYMNIAIVPPELPPSYGGRMRPKSNQKIEESLKLTDVQRRWLDSYLEAKRDFESDRVYESTVTVVKIHGVYKQVIL